MKNKENIQAFLQELESSEDDFQFDEKSILHAYQDNHEHQSLAIKILSVFGGILASSAFLGFLAITGLYDTEIVALVFGILCISGAIWISKKYDKIIIDTLSASSFIIGFILLGLSFFKFDFSLNALCISFILIAFLTLNLMQNYILSFISVLIINASILTMLLMNRSYELLHVYVSILALGLTFVILKEAKLISFNKKLSRLYQPIRIGLIFPFLAGLILLTKAEIPSFVPQFIWFSSIFIIGSITYLISLVIKVLEITKIHEKIAVYALSILLLLPTALAPSISGAILILLLSFLVNYKSGFVIGILAFIYFISQYYYDLNLTLLTKSILLFCSGVLFLMIYLFTYKKLTADEKI